MVKDRILRLVAQDLLVVRLLNREHRHALSELIAEGRILRDWDGRYVTREMYHG